MTDIRRQLDQVVSTTLAQHIIPVKTTEGILVGSVLITSEGWTNLNIYALPIVATTALATMLLWLHRKSSR